MKLIILAVNRSYSLFRIYEVVDVENVGPPVLLASLRLVHEVLPQWPVGQVDHQGGHEQDGDAVHGCQPMVKLFLEELGC